MEIILRRMKSASLTDESLCLTQKKSVGFKISKNEKYNGFKKVLHLYFRHFSWAG